MQQQHPQQPQHQQQMQNVVLALLEQMQNPMQSASMLNPLQNSGVGPIHMQQQLAQQLQMQQQMELIRTQQLLDARQQFLLQQISGSSLSTRYGSNPFLAQAPSCAQPALKPRGDALL